MSQGKTCPICKATRPLSEFCRNGSVPGRCCRYCHNPNATLEERFWAKVRKGTAWSCWEWQAQRNSDGYGIFKLAPRDSPQRASRIAWTLTFGDPGQLRVLHHCDNPPCCNTRHLFLGTSADNSLDCRRKGRWRPGGENGGTPAEAFLLSRRKLTDEQIAEARLRRADGETYRSIGQSLGVHPTLLRCRTSRSRSSTRSTVRWASSSTTAVPGMPRQRARSSPTRPAGRSRG